MITVTGGEGEMQVVDIQGKIVKNITITSNKCSISVNNAGVYVVRIIGNNRTMSQKVIIH